MAKSDIWATIRSEREALAADLEGLTDEQWATPSLCDGWTVQETVGHMTATAKMTPPAFFLNMLQAGFNFGRMTARTIEREAAGSPAETLRRFREQVGSRQHPPGPTLSWLGETIIHAEDIRRPLGSRRDYPTAAVVQVADFYKGSNLIVGAKKRIAGLALHATDADWHSGQGSEVRGPILSLVLAMTGRAAGLADLTGNGVTLLRQRT